MNAATKFAVQEAARVAADGEGGERLFQEISAKIGREEALGIFRAVEAGEKIFDLRGLSSDQKWAVEEVSHYGQLFVWAHLGFPLVTLSRTEDAIALSNTDPPVWLETSPHGEDETTVLGVEVGGGFLMVQNWRTGDFEWMHPLGVPPPAGLFEMEEQCKRFVANVGFALLERPEGLDIREHRPSPKAMRKQGRKHYPTVQYIIQAARDLHPPEPVTERGARDEGWTMSVRTMVRGHWRQQAHGPNHSLRKVIWIRPTWRGPEDAPISIHATRLKATEPV